MRGSASTAKSTFVAVALAAVAALAVGCVDLSGGDGPPLRRSQPAKRPVAAKAGVAPPAPASGSRRSPWAYLLPVDHGIRHDSAGAGQFRAPRGHGQHNGIDFLAPVGTPTFSACNGKALGGKSASFGYWVRVVCVVPPELADKSAWASLFYAHLDTLQIGEGDWVPVMRGQKLGTVGKTGNARDASVSPHLHFEIAVHPDEKKAMADTHAGNDQANNPAADRFFASLSKKCIEPRQLSSHAAVRRGRRADPFIVMSCLDVKRPTFERPAPPLDAATLPWSEQYTAKR